MHFDLIDSVLSRETDTIVTAKMVTNAEEYLQDHFAGYPVLPGVFMLEAMIQAARELESPGSRARLCLAEVRALKYGSFVRPGQMLHISVERTANLTYRGIGKVLDSMDASRPEQVLAAPTACSGRFLLREPLRVGIPAAAGSRQQAS